MIAHVAVWMAAAVLRSASGQMCDFANGDYFAVYDQVPSTDASFFCSMNFGTLVSVPDVSTALNGVADMLAVCGFTSGGEVWVNGDVECSYGVLSAITNSPQFSQSTQTVPGECLGLRAALCAFTTTRVITPTETDTVSTTLQTTTVIFTPTETDTLSVTISDSIVETRVVVQTSTVSVTSAFTTTLTIVTDTFRITATTTTTSVTDSRTESATATSSTTETSLTTVLLETSTTLTRTSTLVSTVCAPVK